MMTPAILALLLVGTQAVERQTPPPPPAADTPTTAPAKAPDPKAPDAKAAKTVTVLEADLIALQNRAALVTQLQSQISELRRRLLVAESAAARMSTDLMRIVEQQEAAQAAARAKTAAAKP